MTSHSMAANTGQVEGKRQNHKKHLNKLQFNYYTKILLQTKIVK